MLIFSHYFRINSPRRQEVYDQEEQTPEEVTLGGGGGGGARRIGGDGGRKQGAKAKGPPGKDNSYISVKLPDDIMQHLGRQYGLDNNKHVQTQILGIPSDHLDSIDFEEESKNKETESQTTSSTTTTTESSTSQTNKNLG